MLVIGGCSQTFGGPLRASVGGPLPQRFPRLVQWGQGAPAAC